MTRGHPPPRRGPPIPACRRNSVSDSSRLALAASRTASTNSGRAAGRAGWQAMIEVHGREILSRAGRLGWAATVAKYGEEFAWDRAAETRRERPTASERAMIALLAELGQRDRVDYEREFKVAPRTHVDFAWPDGEKAVIEVYGGVHFGPFDADGARAAYD